MSVQPSIFALIPARSGSKRIQGKNVRPLQGHPLLAYTVAAARASGIFARVLVSTESEETADIARHYGAEVPFLRPQSLAGDLSPDIEWVRDLLIRLGDAGQRCDCFSLLRPTSPFRQAATIRRAWTQFLAAPGVDSLRAVERCKQHPGKMWLVEGNVMKPLLSGGPVNPPWHSMAYQALPPVYVQNASLEIAWSRVPLERGTIAGTVISPFLTEGLEGFDLNEARDWWYAEQLVASGEAVLPIVRFPAYPAGRTPTTF
jgi:N-acylneuraminate cytidylyltransferase